MEQFIFTEDMMRLALKFNDYYELWIKDNWVHKNDTNKDWSGRSLQSAFIELCRKQNFLPQIHSYDKTTIEDVFESLDRKQRIKYD